MANLTKALLALIVLILTIFALPGEALALIEVAGIAGVRTDTGHGGPYDSFKYSVGNQLGVLTRISLFPDIALRTGLMTRSRVLRAEGLNTTISGTATHVPNFELEFRDSTLDLPLNIQADLPFVGIYVFGGVIYSATMSSTASCNSEQTGVTCNSFGKTPDDLLVNLGAGYTFLEATVSRFSIEAQADYGQRDLTTGIKANGYALSLVGWFGF